MAGPIYYFPGAPGTSISDALMKEKVNAAGLGGVIGDATLFPAIVTDGNGPDGKGGLAVHVVLPKEHPGKVPNTGYYPDDQTWIHVEPRGYWLGLQKSSLPGPSDLQRNGHLLQDYEIKLGDGHQWAVMALYPFNEGSIPRVGKQNANWEWEWQTHPRFDDLIKRYEKVFMGGEDSMGGWADLAVDTLAVNYRVDKHLAMVLGLFEYEHCTRILEMGMDTPERRKYDDAKKKDTPLSEGAAMNAGDTTPPVSPDSSQHS